MKYKAALLIVTSQVLYAGPPEPVVEPPKEDWITPTINIRSRYEFGDLDGLDPSHAFTFRGMNRAGGADQSGSLQLTLQS